jgi:hypothetical protein
MFYFTPSFPFFVKRLQLKVSWQNFFAHHPGMQLKGQTPHLCHWIGADKHLRFGE